MHHASRCSRAIPRAITDVQILMAMMAIAASTRSTRSSRSTTASASTPRRSSCCCRPTASGSASRARSASTGWSIRMPTMIPAIEAGWIETRALVRRRSRHGALHRGPFRCLLHRPRRQLPLQPRHGPARRPLRRRHVHRRVAADRRQRQFLDGLEEPHHRLRRRAQHGLPADGPTPSDEGLAEGRRRGQSRPGLAARPQAGGADRRDLPAGRVPTFVEELDARTPASAGRCMAWRR